MHKATRSFSAIVPLTLLSGLLACSSPEPSANDTSNSEAAQSSGSGASCESYAHSGITVGAIVPQAFLDEVEALPTTLFARVGGAEKPSADLANASAPAGATPLANWSLPKVSVKVDSLSYGGPETLTLDRAVQITVYRDVDGSLRVRRFVTGAAVSDFDASGILNSSDDGTFEVVGYLVQPGSAITRYRRLRKGESATNLRNALSSLRDAPSTEEAAGSPPFDGDKATAEAFAIAFAAYPDDDDIEKMDVGWDLEPEARHFHVVRHDQTLNHDKVARLVQLSVLNYGTERVTKGILIRRAEDTLYYGYAPAGGGIDLVETYGNGSADVGSPSASFNEILQCKPAAP